MAVGHPPLADRDKRDRNLATNVIGKRLLQRAEGYLLRVPVFRTIYAPVKQLVVAFSPDNEYGFKRVVMIEDATRGFLLGFLTREFTVDFDDSPLDTIAVGPAEDAWHSTFRRASPSAQANRGRAPCVASTARR